jgi:hypothetical protein
MCAVFAGMIQIVLWCIICLTLTPPAHAQTAQSVDKLDKGGTIQLEQSDIGNHDWELTTLKLNLKGKALMFKSLDIQLTEQATHFSQVPEGTDYHKAIQLLENSAALIAP